MVIYALATGDPQRRHLKNTFILIALAGLLIVSGAHAQSSTTLIGLREVFWRYVVDPSGEAAFRYMVHCRRFGLMGVEDINPFRYPLFLTDTGSISSTNRRPGAMATMHMQQGPSGLERATFVNLPLKSCTKNEVWSD